MRFLFAHQRLQAWCRSLSLLKQFRHRQAQQLTELGKAFERQATAGQQTLHAGLRQIERLSNVAIGHAGGLETLFQGGDELGNLGHKY
ncbi:hypothetical protein D3C76_949960 [compost metagenome]